MPALVCIGGPVHLARASVARGAGHIDVPLEDPPRYAIPRSRWNLRPCLELREIEGLTGQTVRPPTVTKAELETTRYHRRRIGSHRAPGGVFDLLAWEGLSDPELARLLVTDDAVRQALRQTVD